MNVIEGLWVYFICCLSGRNLYITLLYSPTPPLPSSCNVLYILFNSTFLSVIDHERSLEIIQSPRALHRYIYTPLKNTRSPGNHSYRRPHNKNPQRPRTTATISPTAAATGIITPATTARTPLHVGRLHHYQQDNKSPDSARRIQPGRLVYGPTNDPMLGSNRSPPRRRRTGAPRCTKRDSKTDREESGIDPGLDGTHKRAGGEVREV